MLSLSDIEAFWRNKKVIVTGAAGFLGSHLCQQLGEAGANVIGITRHFTDITLPNTTMLIMQIQDSELGSLISQTTFDTIFHLAGLGYNAQSISDPVIDFELNLHTTFQLLEILRKREFHGCFVYASSAAIYGQPQNSPITEETIPFPLSPYGVSKLAAEHYTHVYSDLYRFQAAIARLFPLYGPGQRKQVVFDIIRKVVKSDGEIALLGNGSEIRDFLYVEDAATALSYLGSLLPFHNKKVFNVCSGRGISIRTLAETIIKIMGNDLGRIHFSNMHRPGDSINWVGSNKLLNSIGFQPRFDLKQGLELTVDWCQKNL